VGIVLNSRLCVNWNGVDACLSAGGVDGEVGADRGPGGPGTARGGVAVGNRRPARPAESPSETPTRRIPAATFCFPPR
jgi:hypothetical protein